MKTKEIKEQLNLMHNFMDADYDYEKRREDDYKIIAKRLNISVEEVKRGIEKIKQYLNF